MSDFEVPKGDNPDSNFRKLIAILEQHCEVGIRDNQIPKEVFIKDGFNHVEMLVGKPHYETGIPSLLLKRGSEEIFNKLVTTIRGDGVFLDADKVGNYDRQ